MCNNMELLYSVLSRVYIFSVKGMYMSGMVLISESKEESKPILQVKRLT